MRKLFLSYLVRPPVTQGSTVLRPMIHEVDASMFFLVGYLQDLINGRPSLRLCIDPYYAL
ncbi:hypothetical protein BDY19DRAFT_980983, partial [Irpex rosettiformis]